jgi:quercetin dioxygenase-like cupin family protein
VFKPRSDAKSVEMFPGVVRRTLASGDRATVVEVTVAKGAAVPPHQHEHEQVGYVAKGRLRFEIGGETRELVEGDSYLALSNVPHGVVALEDSIAIDIFSPPRTEYLD